MANKNLVKAVDLIPEGEQGEWWKSSSRETFVDEGQRMLDAGMSLSEVTEILTRLYYAVADEYGG